MRIQLPSAVGDKPISMQPMKDARDRATYRVSRDSTPRLIPRSSKLVVELVGL